MKYDAIVIGAGPNGLVAAATLASARRKVLVVERADEIGGHTRTLEFAPGFHAPLDGDGGWIPPQVERVLGLKARRGQDVGAGAAMSVASADGTLLTLHQNAAHTAAAIRAHSARDASRWTAFTERLHKFTTVLAALYQLAPPDIDASPIAALPLLGVGRKLRALGRADMTEFLRVMPMSVQDLLDDTFESELLKAAVASCAIRDLRQGPRSGGTTFNLLHYMVGAPAGAVRGRAPGAEGPTDFCAAASAAAARRGVEVRTATAVERISVRDGVVTGVVLANGDVLDAPLVISTADPQRTLLGLVDPVWLDPEFMLAVKNIKLRGCTAYALYAAESVTGGDPGALAAMVGMTPTTTALEQAADAAKYGEISAEPHVEFFVPTLRWPALAPAGKHVVVARVQYAPYALARAEWNEATKTALKEKVTAAIARVLPSFEPSIIHRAMLSPRDVEERFGVTEGALTQGEMTLDQILFMRPVPGWGQYRMPVDGLYLGGAGAHPGPGVLGGAGYLAARRALNAAPS